MKKEERPLGDSRGRFFLKRNINGEVLSISTLPCFMLRERTIKYGKIKARYFVTKWIYCRYYDILIKRCWGQKLLPPLIPDCSAPRAPAMLKNIRNSLIFLKKMATYSCFWRVTRSKILLQASLRRTPDLLTLIS